MGVRARATARLRLAGAEVPVGSVLGATDGSTYAECVRLSRLAWCALAVGTGQAVLDYVIAVRQRARGVRRADQPPPVGGLHGRRHRHRAARRCGCSPTGRRRAPAQGEDFAREVALARTLCAEKGMQIGLDGVQLLGGHGFVKEHPVERWYRDLRARRRDGRRRARLRAHHDQPRDPEEVPPLRRTRRTRSPMNMLRPISRKYDRAEHDYPKELDMLADADRRARRVRAASGAGAAGVRGRAGRRTRAPQRHQPRLGAVDRGDVLGRRRPAALDARARASATRRSPRSPTPEQQERFAGVWAAMAITEPDAGSDSASDPDHRHPRRRRVRPQRREDLRHRGRPRRPRRRLGDPRPLARAGRRSSRSWCPRAPRA